MPKGKSKRGTSARGRGGKGQSSAAGQEMGWLERNSNELPNMNVVRFADDRHMRPSSMKITQSVPRDFASMIYWTQMSYSTSISVPSTTIFSENNFVFGISNFQGYGNMLLVFDQFCIHSLVINFVPRQQASAGEFTVGQFCTAIDFDNVTNLGAISSLQAFASAQTVELTTGQVCVQRTCQPCIAPALYNSGGVFTAYGVQRSWVDSASPSTQHYGVRSIYALSSGAPISFFLDVTVTAICGFRSRI